jgi:serine/threonine protein kinase
MNKQNNFSLSKCVCLCVQNLSEENNLKMVFHYNPTMIIEKRDKFPCYNSYRNSYFETKPPDLFTSQNVKSNSHKVVSDSMSDNSWSRTNSVSTRETRTNSVNTPTLANNEQENTVPTKKMKIENTPITPLLMCSSKIDPIDIKQFGKSIKSVGEGTYGRVDLHKDVSGKEVVIKSAFGKHENTCTPKYGKICKCNSVYELTGDIVREVSALSTLSPHPNIVKMIGVNYMESPMKMVLEKATESLWMLMKKKSMGDCDFTKKIMYHIVRGIQWMNMNGIWHRDLKPQNILIMPDGRAVLADFGLARGHPYKWEELTCLVYTIWWRPPEILLDQCLPKDYLCKKEEVYDEKAEIWAIGMCLWDMLIASSKTLKTSHKYLRSNDGTEELQLWKLLRCFDGGETKMKWKQGKEKTYSYLSDKGKNESFRKGWTSLAKNPISSPRIKIEQKLGYSLNEETWSLFKGMMQLRPEKRFGIEDVMHHEYFDSVKNDIDLKYPTPVLRTSVCNAKTQGILAKNWQVICSWLWRVVEKYKIGYSVYFLALHIMRCYFYLQKANENEIQLVGMSSLVLSALYIGQEMDIDDFKEMMTETILTKQSVSDMEKRILSEVGNRLHIPTSWYKLLTHFVARASEEQIEKQLLAQVLACIESSPSCSLMSSERTAEMAWNLYCKIVNKDKDVTSYEMNQILVFVQKFHKEPSGEPMYSLYQKLI